MNNNTIEKDIELTNELEKVKQLLEYQRDYIIELQNEIMELRTNANITPKNNDKPKGLRF